MLERRKAVVALGRQRFVENRPDVQRACAQISQEVADALGTTLEELRNETVSRYIGEAAKLVNLNEIEMLIMLGADSAQEAEMLIENHRAEIRRFIGE